MFDIFAFLPDNVRMNLDTKLEKWREIKAQKRVSYPFIAQQAGLHENTVYRIFTGAKYGYAQTIEKLSQAMDRIGAMKRIPK